MRETYHYKDVRNREWESFTARPKTLRPHSWKFGAWTLSQQTWSSSCVPLT